MSAIPQNTALSWEQKLAALKALTPTHLEMRAPGDWYVSAYARMIPTNGGYIGSYGNSTNPESAVIKDFDIITSAACVRVSDKYFAWNGFMWREVSKP